MKIIKRVTEDGTIYSKPDGETCQDNIGDTRWLEFQTLINDPANTVEDFIPTPIDPESNEGPQDPE